MRAEGREDSGAIGVHGSDEVLPGIGRAKALFLLAAGMSFVMSVYLFFTGDTDRGIFVGIWVPSILSAGTLILGGDGAEGGRS